MLCESLEGTTGPRGPPPGPPAHRREVSASTICQSTCPWPGAHLERDLLFHDNHPERRSRSLPRGHHPRLHHPELTPCSVWPPSGGLPRSAWTGRPCSGCFASNTVPLLASGRPGALRTPATASRAVTFPNHRFSSVACSRLSVAGPDNTEGDVWTCRAPGASPGKTHVGPIPARASSCLRMGAHQSAFQLSARICFLVRFWSAMVHPGDPWPLGPVAPSLGS